MENQPYHNARPSQGLDAKRKSRKAKSKQSQWPASSPELAPLPDVSLNSSNESAGGLGGRVISALQEFVQDGKAYRMPSRHSILQWHFEERCVPGHRNGKQSYI